MANIYIETIGHSRRFDVINMSLLFWPGSKIFELRQKECNIFVRSEIIVNDHKTKAIARIRYDRKYFTCTKSFSGTSDEDILKYVKQTIYIAGNRATGIAPPWGILTGIRPMSVYEKLAKNDNRAGEILQNDYFVTESKRKILDSIYSFRKDVYYDGVKEDVSLYVSIPFCPSKCSYCSFVSSAIEKVRDLIDPYLKQLLWEIEQKIDILHDTGKSISTVYVGGGTPGILSAEQIDALLDLIFSKLRAPLKECCFEIGRPETVTPQKLEVLKKYPVTRLCINCQTLNDDILSAVGRRHTAEDFFEAIKLAKSYGFECINVDYIAGLPNENVSSHISSLQKGIALGVENITIHSLCIKRASTWQKPNELYDPISDTVGTMLDKGYGLLQENGYYPYYIYRQKSTLSNGENIGYAKHGYIGKYNIYMMEDVHTVIGCGAGASTKIIHSSNGRIDRFVNTKYPQEYLKFPDKLNESILAIKENLKGNH